MRNRVTKKILRNQNHYSRDQVRRALATPRNKRWRAYVKELRRCVKNLNINDWLLIPLSIDHVYTPLPPANISFRPKGRSIQKPRRYGKTTH